MFGLMLDTVSCSAVTARVFCPLVSRPYVHATLVCVFMPNLSSQPVRAGLRKSRRQAEAGVWLVEVGAVIAPQRRCESVIKNIEDQMASLHKHDVAPLLQSEKRGIEEIRE